MSRQPIIFVIARRWIPLAFVATGLCGLIYLGVQQSYRQSANDPQIQIAEGTASLLQSGYPLQSVVPTGGQIVIGQSLAPYLVIYDTNGNPLAGDATLFGSLPHLPSGVFDYAKYYGEDRFTWQPALGIRQAVVLVAVSPTASSSQTTFVMVGRSLREVEIRESHFSLATFGVWFCILGGLLILEILIAVIETYWKKK